MFANQYYTETIKQISRRSVEATLSVLGINNADLRRYLQKEFNKNGLGFLSDPVFELIHPWEQSEKTMADLSETLLLPSLLDALDKAGEMRFAREWFPYRHQLKAWTTLLDKKHKKSVVVTSGTGSGKTECFMVPVLNDLVTEYEHSQQDLVGVRALFVYPLNALINSQRKRMDAWTAPFNRGVRYCLFNGNTPEAKREEQGKKPNEVLSRELMRKSPAPMLVTNTTMLEYMLVRQKDAPVLEQSQGRLRWVILDEAHTYIGSQAAEMALLLRRVLHAFGVESKDVRFVATSATMGGERANQKLKCFIAHLAGIDEHQVEVVGGERQKPQKNQTGLKHIPIRDLKDIDPGISCSRARYDAQMKSDTAHKLNKVQYPARLSEISDALFGDQSKIWQTLEWIDLCSDTRVPGPVEKKPEQDALAFFPVRGHLFHHVLNGLWACANKSCSAKEGTDLAGSWPFGRVYTEHKTQCDCGGPVFELVFCNECTMPYLLAVQDTEGKFQQMYYQQVDEFSLEAGGDQAESDTEPERDNLTTDSEDENKVLIVPFEGANNISTMALDKDNKLVTNNGAKGNFQVNVLFNAIDQKCVCCQFKGYQNIFYRRSFLGSPFYLSNVMSILLDKSQQADKTSMHPYRGKRLLTFTDSRQGTARMAVKLQQDAERETIRSLIYKLTTQPAEGLLDEEIAVQRKKKQNLEIELNQLKAQPESTPTILSFIKDEIAALDKQLQQKIRYQTLSWKEAVEELSKAEDINRWMLDYYKDKDRQFFDDGTGAKKLANIMLAREFARRPKRQNSLETLGMVAVHYPALKKINKPPEQWAQLGFEKNDWPDFLKLIVDFFLRENSIIDINQDWIPWMGARIYPSNVTKPGSKEHAKRKWPRCKKSGRQNRIVRVVCAASKRNPELPKDRDLINAVLKSAWDDLTKSNILKSQLSNNLAYALDINQIAFKACTQAWVCPVTHKLIDSTLKGITPYLPVTAIQTSPDCQREKIMCKKVEITVHNIDYSQFDSNQQQQQAVRDYLYKNEGLNELRKENLWTDVSDKIVEGRRFFRAAEHSAQLPAKRLACYEKRFNEGKINVLNCSTTMEMGIDIGGISVVSMSNVPPHPANYLQRTGRAGRRGETQALSFTLCKDNPHELGVFHNPLWPFTTAIAAPDIALNSRVIVQRHLNSLLLSAFLNKLSKQQEQSLLSMNCQNFFYEPVNNKHPAVDLFIKQLTNYKNQGLPERLDQGFNHVRKNTILENSSIANIVQESIRLMEMLKGQWQRAFQQLLNEAEKCKSQKHDPYKNKIEHDLKQMGNAYLLSELASRSYLPGYGFPVGLASFDHYSVTDYKKSRYGANNKNRDDNLSRMRDRPTRNMAIAIREFSPGADVVLDGLVYHSAGLMLDPLLSESGSRSQKIMLQWRCHKCGGMGQTLAEGFDKKCTHCQEQLISDNVINYIEPTGFAVDFYSQPDTNVLTPHYIKVEEPWVAAKSEFNFFKNTALGGYKSSQDGHVFYHNSGESGQGFAICLRCGRAQSVYEKDKKPRLLEGEHKKLQGKSGSEEKAYCSGTFENHAIMSGLHIGAARQTDVFELYFKNPESKDFLKHGKGDKLAWSLAVVLRQALADILGVNVDEMGFAVKPAKIAECQYSVAGIVLYDQMGGGSGFASSAPVHIEAMINQSIKLLSCQKNCNKACQSCLLSYDTRFYMDLLDRHVAHEFLQKVQTMLA